MLDRINKGVGDSNSIFDRPSLLDKLHSRGSILDKLDHSAPENGLSLDNKGGLLSDLFDDDGNISLRRQVKSSNNIGYQWLLYSCH